MASAQGSLVSVPRDMAPFLSWAFRQPVRCSNPPPSPHEHLCVAEVGSGGGDHANTPARATVGISGGTSGYTDVDAEGAKETAKPHQERVQAVGSDFPSFWIIPSDSSAARSPSLPPQPQRGSSIIPSTDISLGAECARRLPPFAEGPGGEGQFSLAPVGRVLGQLSGWEKREGLSEWTPPALPW